MTPKVTDLSVTVASVMGQSQAFHAGLPPLPSPVSALSSSVCFVMSYLNHVRSLRLTF